MTSAGKPFQDVNSERIRWIRRILVEGLFGRYDYDLVLNTSTDRARHMMLLYGDNGSGKTTLLRTVFHLLNHQAGAGHKTAVLRKVFRWVCVELDDDTRIEAIRPVGQFTGAYEYKVSPGGRDGVQVQISEDDDKQDKEALTVVLKAIEELRMRLFFVTDDREILTNRGAPFDEVVVLDEDILFVDEQVRHVRTRNKRQRRSHVDLAVERALVSATMWAREQVLTGSRQGESDASAIYAQVLERLTTSPLPTSALPVDDVEGLADRLEAQAERSAKYSEFGIPSAPNIGKLVQITRRVTDAQQRSTVVRVLQPYIETLRARLDALKPTHQSLAQFVSTINSFFVDKRLSFDVNTGIEIVDSSGGTLAAASLSSGEKQLLLLFSSILVATGPATVIFIDEPELSLNQKWQRRLAHSLLMATQGRNIQFVLATHSFEILAQNKPNTVTLKHGGINTSPRIALPNA